MPRPEPIGEAITRSAAQPIPLEFTRNTEVGLDERKQLQAGSAQLTRGLHGRIVVRNIGKSPDVQLKYVDSHRLLQDMRRPDSNRAAAREGCRAYTGEITKSDTSLQIGQQQAGPLVIRIRRDDDDVRARGLEYLAGNLARLIVFDSDDKPRTELPARHFEPRIGVGTFDGGGTEGPRLSAVPVCDVVTISESLRCSDAMTLMHAKTQRIFVGEES